MPLRLVLIGSGSIAWRHAVLWKRLVPDGQIARLSGEGRPPSDTRVDSLVDIVVESWEDVLAWEPDAAIVANAASGHLEALERLIESRVTTLVEKPLATSHSGTVDCDDRATERGVRVLVGYVLRHHPLVRELIGLVGEGALGEIVAIRANVGQHLADWRPGRDLSTTVTASKRLGGGALLELSHEIDIVLALAGDAESVLAMMTASGLFDTAIEDVVDLVIRHRSGASSSIHLNLIERPARRTLTVLGTSGSASLDLVRGVLDCSTLDGLKQATLGGDGLADVYAAQMRHFIEVVRHGVVPEVTISSAAAVLAVCDSARESSATGSGLVAL